MADAEIAAAPDRAAGRMSIGAGSLLARIRAGGRVSWAVALALPCCLYLLATVPMSLSTPALSNNDEAYHVQYAEYLLAHHALPPITPSSGREAQQPPLYYAALAGWMEVLRMPQFTPSLPQDASTATNLGGFHRTYTTAAERQIATDVHLLRWPGIGFGLVTVLAGFGSAWALTRRLSLSAAVASTVGLWPRFDVGAGAVTNETLTDALCALALLALLLWLRADRRRTAWAAAVGLLLGLAAISKVTALPVAGLLIALLAGASLWRRRLLDPAVAIAGFALASGWWFVHNSLVYGDPLAAAATLHSLTQLIPNLVLPSWDHSPLGFWIPWVVESVWYQGGSNQLLLPWDTAVEVSLLGLACLARGAWVVWRHWKATPTSRLDGPALALAALGAVAAWVILSYQITQAPARYLLVAITAWSLLLVAGTDRLRVLGRRAMVALPWLWPAVFAGLDAYVMVRFLIPYGGL